MATARLMWRFGGLRQAIGTSSPQRGYDVICNAVRSKRGDSPCQDYDADGKAIQWCSCPSNSTWYINNTNGRHYDHRLRAAGDKPVAVDGDGDGKAGHCRIPSQRC
ncbi:MAG: hypothetical protein M9893_07975 [Pyrinomonadaceae bacterium]|nr:hypothetical protein [Pyrinomonadaceae bacterium]